MILDAIGVELILTGGTDTSVGCDAQLSRDNFIVRRDDYDTLLFQREEPVMLLGAIASAYVDLYRARAAADSGESAMALGPVFDYGRMEFKLRNAARDCRRYTLAQLRRCLDALADADAALKGSRTPPRVVLEKMMAELMQIYGDRSGR